MRSRRLQALFLLSLLGVLVLLGVVTTALAGAVTGLVYGVGVLALLGVGAWRARAAVAPPAGRTCSCCTTTVHDAVQVLR